MLRTLNQAAAISFFSLIVSSSTLAVQLSGIVANQNGDTVAATVYVNGNEFATADVDGYFVGDIAAGEIQIHAELTDENEKLVSLSRTFQADADTEARLTVRPLRRVIIKNELPENTFGPWLHIFEAITPSAGSVFRTDIQFLPLVRLQTGGYSHTAEVDLPEGVYRARLTAQTTGDKYKTFEAWSGFEVLAESQTITIGKNDEYFSFPSSARIIDPAKLSFISDEKPGYQIIRGQKDAAQSNIALTVLNLQTGHINWGSSRADGSFELILNGLPGSEYAIYQRSLIDGWNNYQLGVGTTVRVPTDPSKQHYFSTEQALTNSSLTPANKAQADLLGGRVGAIAQHYGEFDFSELNAGSEGEFSGVVNIVGPNLDDVGIAWGNGLLYLEKIVSADGWVVAANPENSSNFMTVTGLPINGEPEANKTQIGSVSYSDIEQIAPDLWSAKFTAKYYIPSQLSKGRYQIHLDTGIESGVSSEVLFSYNFFSDLSTSTLDGRIGEFEINNTDSTKIDIALLANEFNNGSRGAVPKERQGKFGITPGIITNTSKFIISDSMPGRNINAGYNLEPFIPLVSWTTKGHQVPLPIKFKFPSGSLEVTVVDPSGAITVLGPMPFRGTYMNEPYVLSNTTGGMGGAAPQVYMGLTTLTDDFKYDFNNYGEYSISMKASVFDIYNREYELEGNFAVWRAQLLDLEHGVMPGTPFEVGDSFAPQHIIQPGVPAQVEITVTHYPNSDPLEVKSVTFDGYANRFGYFDGGGKSFQFEFPGEYRVDVFAIHEGTDGKIWAGSRTWGGIVETPNSTLEMRGVKGVEGDPNYRQWFNFDARPKLPQESNTHVGPAYRSGDITWMLDNTLDPTNSAMTNYFSLYDTKGDFAADLKNRLSLRDSLDLDNTGLPFISTTNHLTSTGSPINPFFELKNSDDHWAYYYAASERPGVSVREHIGMQSSRNNYWRFSDTYNYQLGNGPQGDSINDFKFIFGGGVYRKPLIDENYYLGYASTWIHLPDNDPIGGRVMPPFQGAAGGPSGGPIFSLFGKEIDIFFHPLGVRPGSILEVGDKAAFSGHVVPNLDSEVSIEVTTPSGLRKYVKGQANKFGYFYLPITNFNVEEPGPYDVNISVTHTGMTSSGAVEAPYPSGGILGEDTNSYKFYVVESASKEPRIENILPSKLPNSETLNFSLSTSDGKAAQKLYQTTVMPGFVLSQSESEYLDYEYDAIELNSQFPNLDIDLGNNHPQDTADTVTFSFMLQTPGALNSIEYEALQVTLQGKQVLQPVRSQAVKGEIAIEIEDNNLEGGDRLYADLEIDATGVGDLYVALILPGGEIITLGESRFISEVGEVIPFRQSLDLSNEQKIEIVDVILPVGLTEGIYTFYAVFLPEGANVLDSNGWSGSTSTAWSYQ